MKKQKSLREYIDKHKTHEECLGFVEGYESAYRDIEGIFHKMLSHINNDDVKAKFLRDLEDLK